jgi:hypothetical protein
MDILSSWIKSIVKGRLRWSKSTAEWKEAAKYFTSSEFWKEYFEYP